MFQIKDILGWFLFIYAGKFFSLQFPRNYSAGWKLKNFLFLVWCGVPLISFTHSPPPPPKQKKDLNYHSRKFSKKCIWIIRITYLSFIFSIFYFSSYILRFQLVEFFLCGTLHHTKLVWCILCSALYVLLATNKIQIFKTRITLGLTYQIKIMEHNIIALVYIKIS